MKNAADNSLVNSRRWIAGLLAVITLAIYLPVRNHDFIDYDDNCYVYANPLISQGFTSEGLRFAFLESHGALTYWHPVTWLSHMLDCELFGVDPGPQHVVNVLFHIANVVLLFFWLTSLTGQMWRSAAVAMLFAWHPLQVDTVAWIAERKNLLSAMFWILALWSYTRWVRSRQRRDYCGALALYAIGLMCKPAIVTLPCVLLLLDFWPFQRIVPAGATWLKSLRPLLSEKLPFFALTVASCVITIHAHKGLGNLTSSEHFSLAVRCANALAAYGLYIRNALWPTKLAVVYPLVAEQPFALVVAGALAVAVPLVFGLVMLRKSPPVLFGWLWFLGTLVPTIGIVQAGHQAMADRFAYLPLIGLFIAAIGTASDVATRHAIILRHRLFAALGLGLACLAITTRQIDYWVDSKTVFERALAVTPRNWVALNVLGADAIRRHDLPAAFAYLVEAERMFPANPDILCNLGLVFAKSGRFAEAEARYTNALKLNPRHAVALHGLGFLAMQQGRLGEAKAWFRKALGVDPTLREPQTCLDLIARGATTEFLELAKVEAELAQNPGSIELRLRVAELLGAVGRLKEAGAMCETILSEKPGDPRALATLGALHVYAGRDELAVPLLERALLTQTNLAEAHFNLGIIRGRTGQTNVAIAHFKSAVLSKPNLVNAWTSLGLLEAKAGRLTAALEAFQQAVKLQPSDPETQLRIGLAAANLQRAGLASEHLREAARLRPEWPPPLHALAWLWATHPEARERKGTEAVKLARRACELTGFQHPVYLDSLAAALAETGNFPEAEANVKQAIASAATMTPPLPVAELQARLALYRARNAYHQPPRGQEL